MFQKILPRVVFLLIALIILVISMTKASLSLMATENNVEVFKKNEISFVATFGDGETMAGTYKYPETGMTPDSFLYGFKRIRDYLWLTFSKGYNKVELAILMADKKMVEFERLTEKDNNEKAVEAGNEAMEKLEYANGLLNQFHNPDEKIKQLRKQIFLAGLAYKETVSRLGEEFSLDREKYLNLNSRIDGWNKEAEKNRYSWDF